MNLGSSPVNDFRASIYVCQGTPASSQDSNSKDFGDIFRNNIFVWIKEGVSLLKTNRAPVLICNGVCGFIQLVLAFIVRPFLILAFPLLAIVGIALGYKHWKTHLSNKNTSYCLMFMPFFNLLFFIAMEIIHLYDPADVYTLQLILTSLLPIMFWNFIGVGGLLAISRLKAQ
jgi:hypothetical protein